MKKYILVALLAIIMMSLLSAKDFIPAQEMDGYNMRFKTYYYDKFDDYGIDFTGFMISNPKVYKNFSLESDFQSYGDEVYKKMNLNFSLGYTFNDRYTIAFSAGALYQTIDKSKLIFGADEDLPNDNSHAITYGASGYAKILDGKLNLDFGIWNINEPNITLMNNGSDIEKMKVRADAKWQVTDNLQLGTYYERENDEDYFGASFAYSFSNPTFIMNVEGDKEKVTVMPEIDLINYWNFKVGYDYYYGDSSDLNNTNYYLEAFYQVPNKKLVPIIMFKDKRFNGNRIVTFNDKLLLEFEIKNSPRLRYVTVNLDNKNYVFDSNIRERNSKSYRADMDLNDGVNNLVIATKGIAGGEIRKSVQIIKKERMINILNFFKEMLFKEVKTIQWKSTLENGSFDISLLDTNDNEIKKINENPIDVNWTSKDLISKNYSFIWNDSTLTDSMYYKIKIRNDKNNIEAISDSFMYIHPKPVVDTVKVVKKVVKKHKKRYIVRHKVKKVKKVIEQPKPEPKPEPVVESKPEPKPEPKPVEQPKQKNYVLPIAIGIGVVALFIVFLKKKKK